MNITPVRRLLAGLLLSVGPMLPAQTWIGGVSSSWEDAANWNPAVVPDGTGATATFTAAGLAPTGGGARNDLKMSGDHTLDSIQFAVDAPFVTLYVDNTPGPATLTLTGAGLVNRSPEQQYVWLGNFDFNNPPTAGLTFRNQATVGSFALVAIGSGYSIAFRDQSSAGEAKFSAYNVDFYDTATAGTAIFDQYLGSTVTFHDHSTVGSAQLAVNNGSVTFMDYATAAKASIVRTDHQSGSSASVYFRGNSTASEAQLRVLNLTFADAATADRAVIGNFGGQVYSSHGAYATWFSNLAFRDQSTAASASIGNNALGFMSFTDHATAANAVITNMGTVTFSQDSSFANARLIAGSGSYFGYGGYNQPAPSIVTGGVTFKDRASGGSGGIEIASAGAWLDFSGLYTGTGTTGRTALPADGSSTGDVVPDDARGISFGAIRNTTAGGQIFLGGSTLRVGSDNSDATLSARITDVGGAYGSAAGERLHGGILVKEGTGTLTLANPDNSFGSTLVTAGTLRLDGGRINNATVAAAGRLTGNGTVQGSLQNSGVVSPGNSPGTITITGDYTQAPGGSLAIELGSASNYDRLVIGGTATLGGTLTLTTSSGFTPVGNTNFNFITAAAVSGQFNPVVAVPGFGAALTSQLTYTPTGVRLQVTQHPFAGFGGDSPATTALGGYLDTTLANATGEYRNLVGRLNTLSSSSAIATALAALAPDRYAALAENGFLAAATQQSARERRLATLRSASGHGFDVFFDVGQRRTKLAAAAALPAASASLSGGTAGAAWHNDGFALGLAVTQENGDIDLDDTGSRADLKSVVPAVFFQYAGERWFANASAAFSRDDHDVRRNIAFAGFAGTATATASGTRNDIGVNIGTQLRASTWSFAPQAGLLASRWQLDGFAESGAGGANLAFADQSLRSLRTRVGVEATSSGKSFTPHLSVYWLHETADDRALQAGFVGAIGTTYLAPGRPAARNAVQAGLGFDSRVGRHAVVNVAASGLWGDAARVTSDLSAGFRWEF